MSLIFHSVVKFYTTNSLRSVDISYVCLSVKIMLSLTFSQNLSMASCWSLSTRCDFRRVWWSNTYWFTLQRIFPLTSFYLLWGFSSVVYSLFGYSFCWVFSFLNLFGYVLFLDIYYSFEWLIMRVGSHIFTIFCKVLIFSSCWIVCRLWNISVYFSY